MSAEWGYLNTAITNLGTGLKASMMLHLPALSMSGLIKRAVKASAQLGLSIRGFFSESMESLGDMYIIANEITIGLAEKEIIGNLGRIAVQLAGYENRTREELMEKRRVDIEDRVYRAWGTAHLVPLRHAPGGHRGPVRAAARGVRWGSIASVDASTITALLFLSQKSHIQRVLQSQADAVGREAHRLHPGEDHSRRAHATEGRLTQCSRVSRSGHRRCSPYSRRRRRSASIPTSSCPSTSFSPSLKDGEGVAVKALQRIKVDVSEMQAEIEKSLPKGKGGLILGDVPPSKRGQKILEDSAEEARNMGHEYIGTEHLLLAAVKEQGSIVARYLARYNITPNGLREAILQISGTGDYKGSPGPGGQEEGADPHEEADADAGRVRPGPHRRLPGTTSWTR